MECTVELFDEKKNRNKVYAQVCKFYNWCFLLIKKVIKAMKKLELNLILEYQYCFAQLEQSTDLELQFRDGLVENLFLIKIFHLQYLPVRHYHLWKYLIDTFAQHNHIKSSVLVKPVEYIFRQCNIFCIYTALCTAACRAVRPEVFWTAARWDQKVTPIHYDIWYCNSVRKWYPVSDQCNLNAMTNKNIATTQSQAVNKCLPFISAKQQKYPQQASPHFETHPWTQAKTVAQDKLAANKTGAANWIWN